MTSFWTWGSQEPLWTLGPLNVTPYSLLVFLGALTGTLLCVRKKHVRPLLPAVVLGALVFGHVCWVLFCPYDLEAYEGKGYMLLRPWLGGYTLYGALLGGALGALAAGKLAGVKWLDALDALAPGACAVIAFARVGEFFTGEGVGRLAEVEWTHFFPLSVCTYGDEYFQEWKYAIWFWEALAALVLLVLLLSREKKAPRGRQTVLFLTVLGTSQILLEQMRRDTYLRVIIFVRVNQLAALMTLIAVLVVLLVRRKPGKAKTILCLVTMLTAALADMASEFVFDKYEYVPWLYLSMPLAAVSASAMLWAWKKGRGILPAVLVCAATAALLAGYASQDWLNEELTPLRDLVRFLILYGTMAVDLACMALSIRLPLRNKSLSE